MIRLINCLLRFIRIVKVAYSQLSYWNKIQKMMNKTSMIIMEYQSYVRLMRELILLNDAT
jgi:hypothetical protein